MEVLCVMAFPIFAIAVGCVPLFDIERAWRWQDYNNRARGVISQRTQEWENAEKVRGAFLIAFSVSFILLILILESQ